MSSHFVSFVLLRSSDLLWGCMWPCLASGPFGGNNGVMQKLRSQSRWFGALAVSSIALVELLGE